MSKCYVFYHRADMDGLCSAYLVSKLEEVNENYDEVLGVGINYYDDFEKLFSKLDVAVGDKAFLVDFSFKKNIFYKFIDLFGKNNIVWIDHHRSTYDELEKDEMIKSIDGVRNDRVAACMLVWLRYYNNKFTHETLKMLEAIADYDIFKSFNSNKKYWDNEVFPIHLYLSTNFKQFSFNKGITDIRKDDAFSKWNLLMFSGEKTYKHIISLGKTMRDAIDNVYEMAASQTYFKAKMFGFKFIIADCGGSKTSSYLNGIEHGDCDAMFLYYTSRKNGKFVSMCSIYSDPDTENDFSQIAIRFGGGGHPSACGFSVDGFMEKFFDEHIEEYYD